MNNKSLQAISFSVLLFIFLGLATMLVWPFSQLIAMAGILAVLFLPFYNYLTRKIKSEPISAFLIIITIIIIIALPLTWLAQTIVKELLALYDQHKVEGIWANRRLFVNNLPLSWQQTAMDLVNSASSKISSWSQDIVLNITNLLSNVAGFFFACFLILLSTFFFLKDHKAIKHFLENLLPFSSSQETLIIRKVFDAINGVVQGSFTMALIQGTAATIGFFMTGLPQPLIWGSITVMSSFVPSIGTSLVVVPSIVYLFVFKSSVAGFTLLAWYVIVHLSIDNFIGPKLIGSKTKMHPLLVIFSVLGGLQIFGPLGFLFGPIIMAVFVALMEIHLKELDNK
jgi:predicted PurR-regulated permease PerM